MPIYEYSCPACEAGFEVLVRGKEVPVCPRCGTSKIERRLSVPAAHTGARTQNLPICESGNSPPCGAGFCRTGQCDLD